jgi:hypothetical protein
MRSKRRSWTNAFVVLLTAAGLGCGGFVESGDDVKRLTVGAEGGTLSNAEFALVVPPHALDHTVTLSARRAAVDAPAGPAFTVSSTDHVTFLSVPADVAVGYDASVHIHPAEVFAAIQVADVWHALARPAGDPGTAGAAHGVTTEVGTFGVIDCPGGICP